MADCAVCALEPTSARRWVCDRDHDDWCQRCDDVARRRIASWGASFHSHIWIQTRVTVRKRPNRVLTLIFDLWPLPLAWTSLLSMVMTPENFIMVRWQEHSETRQNSTQSVGNMPPLAPTFTPTHSPDNAPNMTSFSQKGIIMRKIHRAWPKWPGNPEFDPFH